MNSNDPLSDKQIIYIEPKKRKSLTEYHFALKGETMQSISQIYGIKLKCLYRKNRMEAGSNLEQGQKIWLKNRKPFK